MLHEAATGASAALKVLTTHGDPQRAVLQAVRRMLDQAGLPAAAIGRVVHATTLFTNALIERRGAPTGLLTTAGFRDTLEIGRERKYDLYDIAIENPAPLVPRAWRLDVAERTGAQGETITPLDLDDVRAKLAVLQAAGVTSVAIMFLHSYADPAHEKAAAAAIAEWAPGLCVTPSHEVVPEMREYDRVSTTVASAYIKPLAARYLQGLADELARGRRHRPAAADAVQRGADAYRGGDPQPGPDARIRPGRRGVGRGVLWRTGRVSPVARLRHGGHHRQA